MTALLNTHHRRLITLTVRSVLILAIAIFNSGASTYYAHATGVSGFQAGNILSDSVLTNWSSMGTDTNQSGINNIQNFLNNQVSSCNTNQAGYTGSTGTVYSPPWICLKDFYENPNSTYSVSFSYLTPSTDSNGNYVYNQNGTVQCKSQTGSRTYYANNDYTYTSLTPIYNSHNTDGSPDCTSGYLLKATIQNMNGVAPSGAISAANIIYNAAKQYQINPQVLLVVLQKEQGLITDTSPAPWEYQSATGYGCPDYSPCTASNAGFSSQVAETAYMFHAIETQDPNWYSPYIIGANKILYSPAAGCGSSYVNIQNLATAALYDYTPYQPDQASLDAGWGDGDACSSYGNRNFYLYFTSWFGAPTGPAYQAKFSALSSNSLSLFPGQSGYIWYRFQNTGSSYWGDDTSNMGSYPLHLATDNPINRASIFSSQWPTANRPDLNFNAVFNSDNTTFSSNQHMVQPGQIGEFKIPISVPANAQPGTYNETFSPIAEGAPNWWVGPSVTINVTVKPPYKATFYSQSPYTSLNANEAQTVTFKYQNTGDMNWYDDTSVASGSPVVHLASSNPINSTNSLGASWTNGNRPALNFAAVYESDGTTLAASQHIVQPGQIGEFQFTVTNSMWTPQSTTTVVAAQPVLEGTSSWNMGGFTFIKVNSVQSTIAASYSSESPWPTIPRGSSATISFSFKNSGTSAWRDDTSNIKGIIPIHLATSQPLNRTSPFGASWTNGNRPALNFAAVYESDGTTLAASQHIVQPGQIGEFQFTVTVPASQPIGTYIEQFQPVAEGAPGQLWNIGGNVYTQITVN